MKKNATFWLGKFVFLGCLLSTAVLIGCTPAVEAPPADPTPTVTPAESTLGNQEQCRTLRVSGADGWYPYFIVGERDEMTGVGVELAQRIGDELDVPVETIRDVPWSRLLLRLEDGTLDAINSIYWTAERAEKYVYTEPYAVDEVRVFVQAGEEFEFNELSDLQGKVGGRPLGGSYGEEFDTYAVENLDMEEVEGKESIFEKLLLGRNDYVVFAYWDAIAYLRGEGLLDEVAILDKPVATNDVHMIFSAESACQELVPEVDRLIAAYRQDGTLDEMVSHYGEAPGD